MDYRYEPDPVKRREGRRARVDAAIAKQFADLPDRLRAVLVDPADLPPPPPPLRWLAQLLRQIDSQIVAASSMEEMGVAVCSEWYESVADGILEAVAQAETICRQIQRNPLFIGDTYPKLQSDVLLTLSRSRTLIEPIADSPGAHLMRTAGREPPASWWTQSYRKAAAELHAELEFSASRLDAVAILDEPTVEPETAERKWSLAEVNARLLKRWKKEKAGFDQLILDVENQNNGAFEEFKRQYGLAAITRWICDDTDFERVQAHVRKTDLYLNIIKPTMDTERRPEGYEIGGEE